MRMAILFAVVHVRRPMIVEVLSRALNAIVKSLALHLTKFGWRRVPAALLVQACSENRHCGGRGCGELSSRRNQYQTARGRQKPFEFHFLNVSFRNEHRYRAISFSRDTDEAAPSSVAFAPRQIAVARSTEISRFSSIS